MDEENLSCTDDILIMVLRGCKYNLKKSESKLKRFLRLRRTIIEKLCQLDEGKIETILDDTVFSLLPYRDKYGRAVFLTKTSLRLDHYSMEDIEPVAMSLAFYLLKFPMSIVCGVSYIGDCKSDSILIFYTILKAFKNYVFYIFDMPIRYGRADFTYANFLIRLFMRTIRPPIPEKLSKRYTLHGNSYENLHSIYHPYMLPKEFDGNLEAINNKFYKERLLNYIKMLKEEGQKSTFCLT